MENRFAYSRAMKKPRQQPIPYITLHIHMHVAGKFPVSPSSYIDTKRNFKCQQREVKEDIKGAHENRRDSWDEREKIRES